MSSDADAALLGPASREELREIIFAQRRELDALRRDHEHANLLIDAMDSLLDVDSHVDPFAGVFGILQPVFDFSRALVLVETDGPGSTLKCIVATGEGHVDEQWEPGAALGKVLAGKVIASLTDHPLGESVGRGRAAASLQDPALCFPLGFRDRRGLVMLSRRADRPGFDRRDIALARRFSVLASHAFATRAARRSEMERQRLHDLTQELRVAQAALSHRANHDALTGLPNRTSLEEHVNATLARGAADQFALAFIDLDAFKQVNDIYGHQVGDGLLVGVARRLRSQLRGGDMLARISGDEFVLVVDPIPDRSALDAVVARMLSALDEPFHIEGVSVRASASIGLAVHPDHGHDYLELRRNADAAMYRVKTTNRGGAAYFDHEIGRAAERRTGYEGRLRRSIDEGRFRCVLQPKVDLTNMVVVGFEALARRLDDDGILRPPGEFIEPATQLGLLDTITHQLLDDLFGSMEELDAAFGSTTTVSLNISAGQAVDQRSMRSVLARLTATGDPERFIIELTEDAFLEVETFTQLIAPLVTGAGVRVSIDDFGTGCASLSNLLEVSVHELKIDRSFIAGIHERQRAQTIVATVAGAVQKLDIDVVAEGVEDLAELDFLVAETPIRLAQGYLFSHPRPASELIAGHGKLVENLDSLSRRVGRAPASRLALARVAGEAS